MERCFAILTALGQGMVAEAIRVGTDIDLIEVAVGDADYVPTEGQTALMSEKDRVPIIEITYDQDNPNWLRVMAVLPPDLGGWNIHEAGIFARNGNMFAVAKLDGAYKPVYSDGYVKEIALDFVLEVASEANVNLVADPNVILATRKWVETYFNAKVGGLSAILNEHVGRKDNPHEVTAGQVGTYTASEIDGKLKDPNLLSWAMITAVWPKHIPLPWSGSIADVPLGWALCDGENGTIDLRNRFIVGAGGKYNVGATGGSETHSHSISGTVNPTTLTVDQMPSHNHPVTTPVNADGIGGITGGSYAVARSPVSSNTSNAGGGQSHTHGLSGATAASQSNTPLYYALAWIQKK